MNTNRRIALLLLLLFFALCLHRACGQEIYEHRFNDFSVFRMYTSPQVDRWSFLHFGAGTTAYFGFRWIGATPIWSIIGSTALGIFYETYKDGFGNSISLTGGKDIAANYLGDVPMHFFGACFGCILESAIKKLTDFKGKVYVKNNKAYVVIPLN